jgi:hypothetical protein
MVTSEDVGAFATQGGMTTGEKILHIGISTFTLG